MAMEKLIIQVKARLQDLNENYLLGGWMEALSEQVITLDDGSMTLKGIQLNKAHNMRRKTHHLYVTDRKDVKAVCNEVIQSLVEFLEQRFQIQILSVLQCLLQV